MSCYIALSSPLCGMGIGLAAGSALMHFRCFYTLFASLQVETDFDINSCDKHVTKVANWSNGIVWDVLLFDFDVVLATVSIILLQPQMMLPFLEDINDPGILQRYRRCCHSSMISTMLPFFDDIDDAAADVDYVAILWQYRRCCCTRRRCCHSSTISMMLLQMLPFFFFGQLSNHMILPPLNH